jgi:hypothetical protein
MATVNPFLGLTLANITAGSYHQDAEWQAVGYEVSPVCPASLAASV